MTKERIITDPKIMRGKPVVKGTRIPVYVILGLLAEGCAVKEIIREYPDLVEKDVRAAIQYASKITNFEETKELALALR